MYTANPRKGLRLVVIRLKRRCDWNKSRVTVKPNYCETWQPTSDESSEAAANPEYG